MRSVLIRMAVDKGRLPMKAVLGIPQHLFVPIMAEIFSLRPPKKYERPARKIAVSRDTDS